MKDGDLRRKLERIEIPDEHDARVRSWELVRAAHAEREPVARPRRAWRPLVAVAVAGAVVAAALSPPGRAVLDELREAVGVERAQPALFSLPAPGRLLVASDAGPWIVQPDGAKRLLGDYREASWSPFGRFVVAARNNELVALEPDGDVRWKLSRPDVRFPRWGGTRLDTRIAYRSGGALRVVAGDGTGDRAACADAVADVPPAWRPGAPHVLAFVAPDGRVNVYEIDTCRLYWRSQPLAAPSELDWSPDGEHLLVVGRRSLTLFAWNRRLPIAVQRLEGVVAAAYAPEGRRVAILRRLPGGRSEVRMWDGSRVFAGSGAFTGLEWSPDGRWLIVAWRDADQLIFIRSAGVRKIEAVSNVSGQFDSEAFPSLAGWCCT